MPQGNPQQLPDDSETETTENFEKQGGIQPSKKSKPIRVLLGFLKWTLILAFVALVTFFSFVWYANDAARRAGEGKLYDLEDVEKIPHHRACLVFGCSEKLGQSDNPYFKHRIDAALTLWQAGKVDCIIVSGDNREKYYNEPIDMRNALIEKGVPAKKIVCDYAGLRTLDSVVRAKEIFGLDEIIFVSQKFQNERAIYIAQANGMKVIGFNAKDVEGAAARKTKDREVLARVKMWLDIHIHDTQPRHLGKKEKLPE